MRPVLATIFFAVWFCSSALPQLCGGQERWAVKDGTDASANSVDLTTVVPKTVSQLVHLHQPHLPNDDTTRVVPDETHLYKVTAHLVKWRQETGQTGDSDYHLVLTDDTLKFSDEHNGVPVTPHSFVGEIPSPDCLSGRKGQFGTSSPFVTVSGRDFGILMSRQAMNHEFSNADLTGAWNDAGGLPVEVTGVGFFDRAHGQTGRARNNIEIHPILATRFLQPPANLLARAANPARSQPQQPRSAPQAGREVPGRLAGNAAVDPRVAHLTLPPGREGTAVVIIHHHADLPFEVLVEDSLFPNDPWKFSSKPQDVPVQYFQLNRGTVSRELTLSTNRTPPSGCAISPTVSPNDIAGLGEVLITFVERCPGPGNYPPGHATFVVEDLAAVYIALEPIRGQ
jgi:hypothetical protein